MGWLLHSMPYCARPNLGSTSDPPTLERGGPCLGDSGLGHRSRGRSAARADHRWRGPLGSAGTPERGQCRATGMASRPGLGESFKAAPACCTWYSTVEYWPRPAVSGWTVQALDQDQEPQASGDEPGDGGAWMISNFLSNLLTVVGVGPVLSRPFK